MYRVEETTYNCPVEVLLNILGKKWITEILWNIQIKRLGLESYKGNEIVVIRRC